MNLTLGDEGAVGEHEILQILDRHEQELIRPLHEKIAGLRGEIHMATSERDLASAQLNNVTRLVDRIAKLVRYAVVGVLLLIAAFLLAFAHGWIGESVTAEWGTGLKWAIRIGVYVADAYILLHAFIHVTIWNPIGILASAVEKKIARLLRRLLGLRIEE